jgi:hypothetical protein
LVPNHSLKFILVLALATCACGLTAPVSNAPTTGPAQEATLAPAVPGITLDQLRNAQYQLGVREDHAVVQLTDGLFQQGTDTTTLDYAYIALTQFTAVGDLTGDGVDEIAAMFLENFGGTGNFGMLAIYTNVNGQPVFLTSVLIDDRPMVNSLSIDNGEVFLDAVVHDFDDGACCPELPSTRRYALVNNQLQLVNYTTGAPTGVVRSIEITSPVNGTEVSGSAQVTGTVTIAPFENTLVYYIHDEAGNQYAAGPVNVSATEFGGPGTFNETFNLEGIPAGTTIYLELQDTSPADGQTILALDVVKLTVK